METDFLQIIKTRRSCRKYKKEQITDEELKAVLEAGTYAPTSRGMQSPYIVAVQNEELRKQLASMNAHVMGVTSNPYYDAPTYVLVLVPADANNPIQDGSCVLENMMLAAHAIGLGSCWIHREREMFFYFRRQRTDEVVGTARRSGRYRRSGTGISGRRTGTA